MATNTVNHRGMIVVSGVSAAGNSQTTATVLPSGDHIFCEVNTVPANSGVTLSFKRIPSQIKVVNAGSNTLTVYPQVGGTINTGSVNAGVTIASGASTEFVAVTSTNWDSLTGTGGGGFGTVNNGTGGQVAYYASTSSAVSGEALSALMDSALGNTQGNVPIRGASTWAAGAPPAAGSTTQVQYNSSGNLAGATKLAVGSSGQLNFTAIAAPGSPGAGDVWYDSAQLVMAAYTGGLTKYKVGTIYQQTVAATALSNPTSFTTLITGNTAIPSSGILTIPSTFWAVGKKLRLTCWGSVTTGASIVVSISPFLGTNRLATGTSANSPGINAANVVWWNQFDLLCTATGASGSISLWRMGMYSTGGVINSSAVVNSLPLNTNLGLDLQGLFGTSNGSNSIQLNDFTAEALN
jgi:hypothetical protein